MLSAGESMSHTVKRKKRLASKIKRHISERYIAFALLEREVSSATFAETGCSRPKIPLTSRGLIFGAGSQWCDIR